MHALTTFFKPSVHLAIIRMLHVNFETTIIASRSIIVFAWNFIVFDLVYIHYKVQTFYGDYSVKYTIWRFSYARGIPKSRDTLRKHDWVSKGTGSFLA
jgi:hypothetical protein